MTRTQDSDALGISFSDRDIADARRILDRIVQAGERPQSPAGDPGDRPSLRGTEEKDAREALALRLVAVNEARDRLFGSVLSNQVAWNILLVLYLAENAGVRHSVGGTIELSRSSMTSALRHIDALEAEGIVRREQNECDGRIFWLRLSRRGQEMMDTVLSVPPTGAQASANG